jgi:hypothetical protein
MAPAAHDLREFHERPLPQGRAAGIHRASVRHHGSGALAHLSSADEALVANAGFSAPPVWHRARAVAHLVWRIRGGWHQALPCAASAGSTGRRAVPLHRAATRAGRRIGPRRYTLGDCRGRKRATSSPDGAGVGSLHPGSMPSSERGILLQAMGRAKGEVGRPQAGRAGVEPVSEAAAHYAIAAE